MFKGSIKKNLLKTLPAFTILVLMIVVASALSEDFSSNRNIRNIISQSMTLAIAAIGQTFVLLLGGIDLSVGSTISLSTVILATVSSQAGIGIPLALLLAILSGAIIGFVNGIGVVRFHIPAMIITISTSSIIKGVSLLLLPKPGGKISLELLDFFTARVGVLTTSSIIAMLLYFLAFFVLHYTSFGRSLYATGNDMLHARQSGISTDRVTVTAYMLSGIFAAIAGMVLSMRVFSGDALIGDSYSMDSVAAAVIGGVSLAGGTGSVIGSLAGAFVLGMINNMMNMLGVYAYYQYIIKGAILVFALLIFRLKRRTRA